MFYDQCDQTDQWTIELYAYMYIYNIYNILSICQKPSWRRSYSLRPNNILNTFLRYFSAFIDAMFVKVLSMH